MLKHNIFRKWVATTLFLLLWTGASLAEQKPVCFRHEATDRIRTGCTQFMGKHDAFPRYECSGDKFDPKDEWELTPCPPLESPKAKRPDVPRTGEESEEETIHLFRGCAPPQPTERDKAK